MVDLRRRDVAKVGDEQVISLARPSKIILGAKPVNMSLISREGRGASWQVFAALAALRLVNALMVKTFFQPDEYFQSLEPAWGLAFGPRSGAWLTWVRAWITGYDARQETNRTLLTGARHQEWKVQLRSSVYPALFASFYYAATIVAALLRASTPVEADMLVATPKVVQAMIAASCDFYSWKLARQLYGSESSVPAAVVSDSQMGAYMCICMYRPECSLFLRSPEQILTVDRGLHQLAVTVCSPWQWFCSTRTLSNCLETSLTVLALCSWPWARHRIAGRPAEDDQRAANRSKLRRALLIAAVACILRPTNILIWVPLAAFLLHRMTNRERARSFVDAALCG